MPVRARFTTSKAARNTLAIRLLIAGVVLPVVTFALTTPVISDWSPALMGRAEAGVADVTIPLLPAPTMASAAAASPFGVQGDGPLPVTIGSQIAGTFEDATGHSGQSHLVYAANSRVWWLFTLTSSADSEGGSNHIVKSYRSSGPDLTTATWTPGADSPPALANSPNQSLGGGRSLGVAYLNNSPLDVIHADISMAFDGQDGRTGHIRAVVTGTSITWASWHYFDEGAATWTIPRGNTIGVSTGKFIHTGGPILQQEVDANARKSTTPDTGSTWTPGFTLPAVIDGTMLNQDNAIAFAPLAADQMLAVYDNGQDVEPRQTNLRFKKSNADGTWRGIVVGSQTGGDGNVFASNALINQNDWAIVPVGVTQIYAFRRRPNGTGVDAASYNAATNTWSAMAPAPPLLGSGQLIKSGAGLFGATDGTRVWLAAINTDLPNSILYARFDGTAWTPWAIVPGTNLGIQNRNYISGYRQVGNNQIGLIWTEGTSVFDVVTTSIVTDLDVTAPTVSVTAPLNGATVSGTVAISATASDNVGVAGVQFRLDGAPLGLEVVSSPYTAQWNTAASANGTHVLTATARDQAGNTAASSAVAVTVANVETPIITWPPPQRIVVGTPLGAAQLNATANTPGTFAYTPPAGTILPSGFGQTLSVLFTPTDPAAFRTASASVTIDVVNVVPNVVGLTQAAATSAITAAGLRLGTVTQSSSATVPAGSVISQSPAGGVEVAANAAVALVVSSGAPIAVPNVVGLTQATATNAITSAGLILGTVTTASSTTVPSGSVISQTPAAGTQVASGSAVALVVSSGPGQTPVPNVVGLTQTAATTAITSGGLTVGAITTASSTTVPAGRVISQTPAAGTQVASGSAVALVVSIGPPQIAVPNVVGLTQAAASTAIESAGLVVGAITTTSSTTVPSGSVISQNPAAAALVPSGSAVSLVVSTGPPAAAVLSVDKTVSATGVGTLTTPAFSTSAPNEMLVVFAASAGPTSASPKQMLTISGAGLTWTLVNRVNVQFGSAEIWKASASLPLTNVTVTSTQALVSSYHQSLTVVAFQGAGGTGAIGAASAMFGPTSGSLTTNKAGSLVYSVADDSARAVSHALGANQSIVHEWVDTAAAYTFWVQKLNTPVAAAGTLVTINNPSPTSDRWNLALVEILVGTAPAGTTVPNVVDLAQAAASTTITNAGLTVGEVTAASSTVVPAGAVISQTPAAGTQVASGSAVALIVSSGPPLVVVPNVVGLTQAAATTAITNAGLVLGTVTTASSTTVPAGSVISENPAAATQVTTGSAVALVVSSGPPQVAVPNVVGLTQAAATTAITNAGLVLGTVTTTSSTIVPAGSVISQNPAAATQVATGSSVALVVSSGPPQVAVPDVVGLTQAAATTAITNAGLVLGTVTTASSTTVPAGSVISQNPAAATQVAIGSAVALVVSSGPPQVAVPNVVGLTQAAATTAITNAGLVVGTITTASSTTVPAGSVISQNPAAATQVATGSAVALVVSSGPPQVAVPDVVGLTQAAATTAITNAGLVLGTVTTASSTTVPAGSVISQNPAAATQVTTGSAVAIVVSSGPSQVSVPNVVGLPQAIATNLITSAGLTLGPVTTVSSTMVPAGSVISQTPSAGTPVANGSAVTLVVSSGPPTFDVPNVVGLTQSAATTAITNAGLVVGTVTTASNATVPAGIVISQSPAAGTQATSGAAVSIVVSSGPPPVSVPNVVGLTQAAATTAITNAGLVVGTVTTAASATVPAGSVISQSPAPATLTAPGSAVSLVVSSGVLQGTVPDVVGLTQAAATTAITNAGFVVGTVTTSPSQVMPAGAVISQTPIGGTMLATGAGVSLVLSAGPTADTLRVDVSVSVDGNGAVNTPAFSTSSTDQVLVAFASSDGPSSLKQTLNISGAGLVWTLVARSNTQMGTAEVWTATAPGPLANAVVTSTQSRTTFHQSLTVVAFLGASGIGDAAPGSNFTQRPSVSLITTQPGSLIYGVGIDPQKPTARTLPADQTMVHEWVDRGDNADFWVQAFIAPVANGGDVATVNVTSPTNDAWNMVAVEILKRF